MNGIYPVFLADAKVGEAQIDAKGLYYSIYCRCALLYGGMYRLSICGNAENVDLGVLIFEHGQYILRMKIAKKKLPSNKITFRIFTPDSSKQAGRILIDIAELSAYLHQLEHLKITKQADGSLMIGYMNDDQSAGTV